MKPETITTLERTLSLFQDAELTVWKCTNGYAASLKTGEGRITTATGDSVVAVLDHLVEIHNR